MARIDVIVARQVARAGRATAARHSSPNRRRRSGSSGSEIRRGQKPVGYPACHHKRDQVQKSGWWARQDRRVHDVQAVRPWTWPAASTTAPLSGEAPMAQVPTVWGRE
jgi:hypothetical protein